MNKIKCHCLHCGSTKTLQQLTRARGLYLTLADPDGLFCSMRCATAFAVMAANRFATRTVERIREQRKENK